MELNKHKYHQFLIKVLNDTYLTNSFYENTKKNAESLQIVSDELLTGVKIFYNTFNQEIPALIESILDSIKNISPKNIFTEYIFIIDSDLTGILDNLYDIIEMSYSIELQIWDINVLKKYFSKFGLNKSLDSAQKNTFNFQLNKFPVSKIIDDTLFVKTKEHIDKEFFINRKQICVLKNEFAGSGKTSAAVEYAFSRKNKFKHIAYVKINNNFRIDFISSFFETFKTSLKNHYIFDDNIYLNFYNYIDVLSQLEPDNLLIIDGISAKTQIAIIKDLLKELKFKILVISHIKINDFPLVELHVSKRKTAIKIFKSYVPAFNEQNFDDIFEKVDYNLFLLNFIGKQIKNNRQLNFNLVYKAIKSIDAKIYHISKYIAEDISEKAIIVNKSLFKRVMAIYELQVKDFNYLQKKILSILSVFPERKFSFNDLQNLLNISNEKIDVFADSILDLFNKGWIYAADKIIYINNIVQKVLHKKLKPKANQLKETIYFLNNQLLSEELIPASLFYWSLSVDILNHITTISEGLALLAESTGYFCENLGLWDLSVDYYDAACLMLEDLWQSKVLDYSSLSLLSDLAFKSNNLEKALYYSQMLLEVAVSSFSSESEQAANVYVQISLIYDALNDFNNSIFYITEAIDILELIYKPEDLPLKNAQEIHDELSNKYRAYKFEIDIKNFIDKFYD